MADIDDVIGDQISERESSTKLPEPSELNVLEDIKCQFCGCKIIKGNIETENGRCFQILIGFKKANAIDKSRGAGRESIVYHHQQRHWMSCALFLQLLYDTDGLP
ncbi:5425_t:CDS:2 [Ambispora leptoticha]|uniref:5425_t:CDS:1 n=1 Tax=Ambispora leptoticha TaxID=144679 RepID=A0A9N9GDV4_9GLOM|nr:5425_t:CDS:2 [Ambispora leptoticha]